MKCFLVIHHQSMKLSLSANPQAPIERNVAVCYVLYLKEDISAA